MFMPFDLREYKSGVTIHWDGEGCEKSMCGGSMISET